MASILRGQHYKTNQNPQGKKKYQFVSAQEACRKDIERDFGVLQAQFDIVQDLAHFSNKT
jgi:hypothetical protein